MDEEAGHIAHSVRTAGSIESEFMSYTLYFDHGEPWSRALKLGWFCYVGTIYGESAAGADV